VECDAASGQTAPSFAERSSAAHKKSIANQKRNGSADRIFSLFIAFYILLRRLHGVVLVTCGFAVHSFEVALFASPSECHRRLGRARIGVRDGATPSG
jgi:hypothetical protein